jgi:hypothetical protein
MPSLTTLTARCASRLETSAVWLVNSMRSQAKENKTPRNRILRFLAALHKLTCTHTAPAIQHCVVTRTLPA